MRIFKKWGGRSGPTSESGAPTSRAWSLRRRFLLMVMGTSISLWLVSLAIVVGVAWVATSEVLDDALEEGARLVLQLGVQGGRDAHRGQDAGLARGQELKLRIYYQLVAPDGRVIVRGEDTPKDAFLANPKHKEETTVWVDGKLWRVHARTGEGGVTAQVGQPMEERLELLSDMAENLAWPALGLLALLGFLSWFLIRRLLRPLEDTALRISAKSPDDLTPVLAQNPPRELQSILDALNALLARLGAALSSERRFTADAAHELRTPLAALRMRIQLIERELKLPGPHLQQLRVDLDRCTALVESLLALARLEPQSSPPDMATVDLHAVLDSFNLEAAQAMGMRLERSLAEPHIWASPSLAASALRNLFDNAVRYGQQGGRVRIETTRLAHGGVRLAVRDDGIGVPADQRERLGERFFRVLGTGRTGNGLGLSIVSRIAQLHGASLRFEDGLDGVGLSVVLDFPPRS
ncbi:MAG: sensor histidine kinase N-terminal domain-containing protein [Comamonadaceae bacterium]|nr:sensor histidine kinase N-terminal domain-containing protein [Comamonadaceae bacterium]